jgi:dipeptide/tripeptide permease
VQNQKVSRGVVRAVVAAVALSFAGAVIHQAAVGRPAEIELQASQIAALNPLMVMVIIPALNGLLWRPLEVPQYLVMTTAEVLVSTTGLEFAYTQAPRAMKSTIMGYWLLCVTIGNLIVAFLAPLERAFPLSVFFFVFAALMTLAALVFSGLAYRYQGKTYLQG